MNILQFKRNDNSKRLDLSEGELYIDTSAKSVWVGTNSKPNPFQIKSRPIFGIDIVNQGGNVIPKAVQDFTITNGTGGNSIFNITYVDGSTDTREVTLSGSVASANYATSAGTASKLSTQRKGANTTNAVQPIWWNNSLPEALTATSGGANNPVYVDKGVIKPVTGIDRPNIRATGSLGLPYIQTEGALLAVTGQQGEIGASHKCGDAHTPIYIQSNGVPAECEIAEDRVYVNSNGYPVGTSGVTMSTLVPGYNNGLYSILYSVNISGTEYRCTGVLDLKYTTMDNHTACCHTSGANFVYVKSSSQKLYICNSNVITQYTSGRIYSIVKLAEP